MKIIHNPDLYWPLLKDLIDQIAEAKRQHKQSSHLEREAVMIRTAIIAWEYRHERPALGRKHIEYRGNETA